MGRDHLVGFARALTDGIYRVLIDNVVVEASKRRAGIGSELIRRLLQRLEGIEKICLRCSEHMVPFYQRLGSEKGGVVMDQK